MRQTLRTYRFHQIHLISFATLLFCLVVANGQVSLAQTSLPSMAEDNEVLYEIQSPDNVIPIPNDTDAGDSVYPEDSGIVEDRPDEPKDITTTEIVDESTDESDIQPKDETAQLSVQTEDGIPEFTTFEDAVNYVREQVKLHEETIVFKLPNGIVNNLAHGLKDAVLAHTGIPDEGDYLRWGTTKYGFHSNGITRTVTMGYYTTREQEAEVSEKINEVFASLDLSNKSELQKLSTIYDYICRNVVFMNSDEGTTYVRTAHSALFQGKASCQGYATLLYRMALMAGIDCRFIRGTANGAGHGWNIARIDGVYYYLDAAWDSFYVANTGCKQFLCGRNNEYFVDRILSEDYKDEYAKYPVSETDYISIGTPIIKGTTSTVSGVKVTWNATDGAESYLVQRRTGRDATYHVIGRTSDTYYIDKSVSSGTSYTYRICAMNGISGVPSSTKSKYFMAAPTLKTATLDSNGYVSCTCNSVEGASLYYFYRRPDSSSAWVQVACTKKLTTKNLTQANLVNPGESYQYAVRSRAGSYYSAYSAVKTVKCSKPNAPTSVKLAKKTPTSISVSWKAPKNASYVEIYTSTNSSCKPNTSGTRLLGTYSTARTTSATATKLAPSKTHYFKLRSFYKTSTGSKLYSSFSSIASIKTDSIRAPYGMKASSSSKSNITIEWTVPVDATGVEVYRSTKSSCTINEGDTTRIGAYGTSKNQCISKGLKSGKRYYYRTRAYATINGKKYYSKASAVVSAVSL